MPRFIITSGQIATLFAIMYQMNGETLMVVQLWYQTYGAWLYCRVGTQCVNYDLSSPTFH